MIHWLEFYHSPLGQMTRDFLAHRLQTIFKDSQPGERILIIGFGVVFAQDFPNVEQRQITLAYLNGIPPVPWPEVGAHQACIVSTDSLPFGDVTFDKVIMIHALEFAADPARLLLEVQRVLTAQGQLVCITPNRNGMWAWFEHTPFGEGQAFSRRQLRRLLLSVQLSPLEVRTALYIPPLNFSVHPWVLACARGWERMARTLNFRLGGAVIATAQKQRYAGIPVTTQAQIRKMRLAWATPNASTRQEN